MRLLLHLLPVLATSLTLLFPGLVGLNAAKGDEEGVGAHALAWNSLAFELPAQVVKERVTDCRGAGEEDPLLRLVHILAELLPREHRRIQVVLQLSLRILVQVVVSLSVLLLRVRIRLSPVGVVEHLDLAN